MTHNCFPITRRIMFTVLYFYFLSIGYFRRYSPSPLYRIDMYMSENLRILVFWGCWHNNYIHTIYNVSNFFLQNFRIKSNLQTPSFSCCSVPFRLLVCPLDLVAMCHCQGNGTWKTYHNNLDNCYTVFLNNNNYNWYIKD